jgi:hypothetical protein
MNPERLERSTSTMSTWRSNQLNYGFGATDNACKTRWLEAPRPRAVGTERLAGRNDHIPISGEGRVAPRKASAARPAPAAAVGAGWREAQELQGQGPERRPKAGEEGHAGTGDGLRQAYQPMPAAARGRHGARVTRAC